MAFELLPKHRDLGGFSVKRLLPHPNKRALGPFVFFDHMGPAAFPAGTGIDVRPHPHIGLATVTYLIEGSILHRDSLGNVQEIFPGDINWMTAGRGIVHSERESLEVRAKPHRANGFQIWLALPPDKETVEPEFFHYEKNALPHVMEDGVMMRILVGNAFERDSPAKTYSPTFYVDILANAGRGIDRPHPDMEAGVYIQTGSVGIGDKIFGSGSFVVLEP
ncbi:MAG: pirin family protein, partial [Proteobacteria bacterium]